jgi:hypothetical protein
MKGEQLMKEDSYRDSRQELIDTLKKTLKRMKDRKKELERNIPELEEIIKKLKLLDLVSGKKPVKKKKKGVNNEKSQS